jgi:hypothetical protein
MLEYLGPLREENPMKSRTPLIKAAITAVVLAFTFTLTGCGSDTLTEKAIEKSTGDKVDIDSKNGEYKVKTEDGEFTTSQKLPDNFPKDIPLVEGTIRNSTSVQDANTTGFSVMMSPKDSASKAMADARAKLTAAGFKVTAETNAGNFQMIRLERADWDVAVQLVEDKDSIISYMVTKKSN